MYSIHLQKQNSCRTNGSR